MYDARTEHPLSSPVVAQKRVRDTLVEKKNIYIYVVVYIEASRSPSPTECKATDVLRAHFSPSPSEASPETFFLDSISRLPRDRIVEMARALFRVSCHENERVPAAAQLLSDSDMWQMKGAEQRRTRNESISYERAALFSRIPSARECRISKAY